MFFPHLNLLYVRLLGLACCFERERGTASAFRSSRQIKRQRNVVQGLAKRWSLGCVNSLPTARGSQEVDSRNLGPTF